MARKPQGAQPDPGPAAAKVAGGSGEIGSGGAPGAGPEAEAAQFAAGALDVAAVQTACIALSDAAQHVRRTAILAEAATIAALTRSLTAAPDDKGWVLTLEAVQQSMQGATGVFSQMSKAALQLVKDARAAR
ncbi:MAG: hypothetical protein KA105_07835 [Caulobacter sp.]|jgi:hypothetical protein|nr:hypothetical protein [Caulobacter sp.]